MPSYEESLTTSIEYFNGNELAAKVFCDKYALRDNENNLLELTPDDMHHRIAREFARIEKTKFKEPLAEEYIYQLLKGFEYIIPQGSPLFGIGNEYQNVTLSNCYVLDSPEDSYASILNTDHQLVQIAKRRGGNGIDISNLRPNGSSTNNSSRTSTGIIPFMERYSNSTREVGQGNRRGALMVTLDIHHPESVKLSDGPYKDIVVNPKMEHFGVDPIKTTTEWYDPNNLDFATVKYDRTKITGANISLKLSDEFLSAVKNKKTYKQRWPIDSDNGTDIDATRVWDKIITSSWQMAEPGIIFWDNVLRESPAGCYPGFKEHSTNPCCHAVDSTVMVKTKTGLKELKEITEEDEIWITDAFHEQWLTTSGYFRSGKADVYKVKFSNDDIFYVTMNHNFAVMGGYAEIFELKPLALLKVGDELCADKGELVKIESIEYYGIEEVGCINVVDGGFFVTESGLISGNSELPLCPMDSCRLMVLNLFSFIQAPFTKQASLNKKLLFEKACLSQRLMDDLIDLELEKIENIIKKIKSDPELNEVRRREETLWENIYQKCEDGRRTGLGVTAVGDALAALGIKYGTKKSLIIVDEIMKIVKFASYHESNRLAKELNPFPIWDWELEKNNPFINRIRDEELDLDGETISGSDLFDSIKKFGRRNIANLTIAPCGSISILAKVGPYFSTSSGIEPVFQYKYIRRKKKHHHEKEFRTDFIDQNGDEWMNFTINHSGFQLWKDLNQDSAEEDSPYNGSCANEINWLNRVKLQSSAQKHIDHAISSTINLPADVPKDEVSKIFLTAWQSGLKGITVYRDGCRSGVLITDTNQTKKRPKNVPCEVHHVSVQGQAYFVLIGILDSRPYEIFAGRNGIIDSKIKTGLISKMIRPKQYKFISGDVELCPLSAMCGSEEQQIVTRLVSLALQNGTSVEDIITQLDKVDGPLTGFSKAIIRAFKKYIKDGTNTNDKCPKCEADLIYENGCKICKYGCGYSAC